MTAPVTLSLLGRSVTGTDWWEATRFPFTAWVCDSGGEGERRSRGTLGFAHVGPVSVWLDMIDGDDPQEMAARLTARARELVAEIGWYEQEHDK
jgi:hypothetical protein